MLAFLDTAAREHGASLLSVDNDPSEGVSSMKVDFADKTIGSFNYEFARGISTQYVGAAEFGECVETVQRIKNGDFESWTVEWTATADAVAGYAASMATAGERQAAARAHLRASNYYRMAAFYLSHTDPRHRKLWQSSRDHFRQMTKLGTKAIDYVELDFEDSKLPAYYVSAPREHSPTLIALGGFDSTMEEVYCWIGAVAAEHGYNRHPRIHCVAAVREIHPRLPANPRRIQPLPDGWPGLRPRCDLPVARSRVQRQSPPCPRSRRIGANGHRSLREIRWQACLNSH
jgi:hypothetical protein